jgi:uncharacterized protein
VVSPDLRRNPPAPGPLVRGFTADGFLVDGQSYRAVLLTPERAAAWDPPAPADLGLADLEPLLALEPPALVQALEVRGIGLEAMDSRAAARTWGILRAEERWIAAALMPLGK